MVWINATNVFDAGAPFGGMRESGFWREGGQSYTVMGKSGAIGQAALAKRKDIRNAVEAAAKAEAWGGVTTHNRAQVLYFLAENLEQRRTEFVDALAALGIPKPAEEVEAAIRRAFWAAAQADKFDGTVTATKSKHVTMTVNEPFGVMGIVAPDEAPLLGLLALVLPAVAMGNRVIAVASQSHPLIAARLYQVFETSDLPGGVINLMTGDREVLARTLAEHDEVAALWYCGSDAGAQMVETASAGNLKPVWCQTTLRDWQIPDPDLLRRATQDKTIWIPFCPRIRSKNSVDFVSYKDRKSIATALTQKRPTQKRPTQKRPKRLHVPVVGAREPVNAGVQINTS